MPKFGTAPAAAGKMLAQTGVNAEAALTPTLRHPAAFLAPGFLTFPGWVAAGRRRIFVIFLQGSVF